MSRGLGDVYKRQVYLFSLEKRDSKYEVNLDRVILKGHKMEEDLREINLRIEEKLKKNPENYLWSHRRFKNRPEGEKSFYPEDLLRKRS